MHGLIQVGPAHAGEAALKARPPGSTRTGGQRTAASRPGVGNTLKGFVPLLSILTVLLLTWAFYVLYAAPWLVQALSPVHDFPY